jgi:plastocyanin
MQTRTLRGNLMTLTAALALACSGGSPSSPGGGGGSGGGGTTTPPTATTTITITSSGANPRSISVSPGARVTFINNDSRAHDMASDPHPEHTDCPALNDIGFLTAGQQKTSGNLNAVRTCRFHDHNDPFNTSLQGSIVIQ